MGKKLNPINVIKDVKDNFTKMDNGLLNNNTLSDAAYRLLTHALSKPSRWVFSRRMFMKNLGWGDSKVGAATKELKENGYLEIGKYKNPEGKFETYYRFHMYQNEELIKKNKIKKKYDKYELTEEDIEYIEDGIDD